MFKQNFSMVLGGLIVIAFATGACGKIATNSNSGAGDDAVSNTAEMAVTAMAGTPDDAQGSSYAMTQPNILEKIGIVPAPAWAATCARPSAATCTSSSKTAVYAGCTLGTTSFTLNGSAVLAYANASCDPTLGAVVRAFDVTRTGPLGGSLHAFTSNRAAYDGTTYGGGETLTPTGGGNYTLQIAGVHKVFTFNSKTIFDHTIHTTSNIVMAGLARAGRTVSSGTVEVLHNLAKYKADYSVAGGQPLTWVAGCCYPTSGTLHVSLSGSVTGSGSVTFTSCGAANVTINGSTNSVSFNYCE